ncbi:MAG: AraC family transcriptional regulator [Bacteroides sp.]|nr:AraC family transcriptional regulator [Bacteroides sp.]
MDRKDIFFTDTLEGLSSSAYNEYLSHALCLGGTCSFTFNGGRFELHEGDLMIVRRCNLIENLQQSADFKVTNFVAKYSFIELCTPRTNYGMRGQLSLFINPVMRLNEEQQFVCARDFRWIEYRLGQSDHKFYHELLTNAVQAAILDFFDFHATINEGKDVTPPGACIMSKFLAMLENKTYRVNREVTYYADALCVTPKYLSEISKKVSGFPANYWINRYTTLDIAQLLRDKSLTFVQISDLFNFSSPAYFSRYVQRNLGVNPSKYRE